jgi:hypothetical protein
MSQPANTIQSVFNKGEIGPRLYGRVDNKYYYNAFKYSLNLEPYIQGSIGRRQGTVYVAEVKTSSKFTRMIPFQFSSVQNYALEFGDQYFRIYRNRGQVISGTPVEVATPYLEADLRKIKYTQSADVLYVFCDGYQPRKITRTSDTSWSISTITFLDGPYLATNATATTITPSATTGAITLTASTSTFTANDVGRLVRLKHSSTWGNATITSFTSGTVVNATVNKAFGATGAVTDWRLGTFSNTLGWPRVGIFNEERLVLGNTASYPNTVWGSVIGDFENFQPSKTDGVISDDDAFTFQISDDQVNAIYWMSAGKIMMIGTSGGEYSMSGGSSSGNSPITPDNVVIKRESNIGSADNLRIHRVGSSILHVSPSSQKIRELSYDFSIDTYLSNDLNKFANHINIEGILDLDYTSEPDPTIWCVMGDGSLNGVTYEKQEEVVGYHRHILGGTNTVVESVCVIPKPDKSGDDLWLSVKRTVNGTTKRYVEYKSDLYNAAKNGQDSMWFVDSGIEYNGYQNATLTPSAVTGSGITFTAGSSVFAAGDVNAQIWYNGSKATITGYTSGTVVTCTIFQDFPNTNPIPSGDWAIARKTFTGASHLTGETCRVTADGGSVDDATVSAGSFTLANFAARVQIGFGYDCYLDFLPIDIPQLGTISGRIRRVERIHLYLYETLGLECREQNSGDYETLQFQNMGQNFGEAPPLFSGTYTMSPPYGYGKDSILQFRKQDALPLSINYVVQELGVGG